MKIFGFQFGNEVKQVEDDVPRLQLPLPGIKDVITLIDQDPEAKAPVATSRRPALIPPVADPTRSYLLKRDKGRGRFESPEYDLSEMGRVEDTDSYVRQAFDKKVALMFKEDWNVVGPNPKIVRYTKTRLEQLAQASGTPTKELFRRLGSALVRKSNAFIIKVRDVNASGGSLRRPPGSKKILKPVAGYFIAPAETMEYESSSNKITAWRQRMPDGSTKRFKTEDVIHIFYDRKEGFVFGTPTLIPVMDDVRALRKIEENVEMLVYQHLFPLFQYIVGTMDEPAGIDEAGRLETDVVRSEIRYMPTEGGIVTPHRHEIKVLGAEGRALNAEKYLDYFKKRVFSGLGVSAVDMGEGETANRATADNMSRNMIDSVKDFQQVMEAFVNEFVIKELLLESTFGSDVLDEEMRCWMKFKEIDVESQIKKEAHHADQFAKDIITWDEARTSIGKEPIAVPTPDEVDSGKDLSDKYPEWYNTRWKLFKEPELLIQSLDEAYSPLAKAVARNNSLEATSADIEEAGEAKKNQEVELEKERGKAKVAVAKATPKVGATRPSKSKKKQDGYLKETFIAIKEDVVVRAATDPVLDIQWIGQLIRTQMSTTIDRLIADQMISFHNGYSAQSYPDTSFIEKASLARTLFRDRAEHFITKLTNNLISRLNKEVAPHEDPGASARAAFDALEYRTTFIEDVEVRKAQSLGIAIGMRDAGALTLKSYTDNLFACDRCKSEGLREIDLQTVTLDQVPPHHAGCGCVLTAVETVTDITDETVTTEENEVESEDSRESDFNRCKIRVAANLRREHPDWDEGTVKQLAEASCEHIRARRNDG